MNFKIIKEWMKNNLPSPLLHALRVFYNIIVHVKSFFVYHLYDSSAYWRSRAKGDGESRVLWKNEEYNRLYRDVQRSFIEPYIRALKEGDWVLDIGCGIGRVAKMMAHMNPKINIDAVDFPEMVEVAVKENKGSNIRYIASSAEAYYDAKKKYSLILSSACFSAIRHVPTMERAIENCVRMLAPGGYIIMMDPFHTWNYLARVKYSSKQVIKFMKSHGLELIHKSGVLFWPYRVWLCNADLPNFETQRLFRQGEMLLSILGKNLWSDYKILVFKKLIDGEKL